MSEREIRTVAKNLLDREEWFRQRIPAGERDRYVDSLADEMKEAAESQLQHFRESLHVSFVGRED